MSVYPIILNFPRSRATSIFPGSAGASLDTCGTNFLPRPKGTRPPLHYDTLENLLPNSRRKSFLVISPEFHDHCYPVNEDWQDGYSQIDIKAPDLAKFPRFAEVRAAEVILGPGDLLYVPARWWHSVQSLDVSISINQWFCTEAFAKAHADKLYDPEAYGPTPIPSTNR
ncbi:MAG: cupin-like domain-containing protein [Verrucomicrobiales bacterium]